MTTTVKDLDQLLALSGQHLGYSEWLLVDQERVDGFAEATGDHQWIHVDPKRAKEGPFGGTIAHGYLTLSLAPALLQQVLRVEGMSFGVNYGCNKVRFPAPLPVGSRVRMGVTVAEATEVEGGTAGGVQAVFDLELAAEGSSKPSCVAQVVYRYYR